MKKYTIYGVGVFYSKKIQTKEFTPSVARRLRDAFKPIFEVSIQIEKDRAVLVERFKDDAPKLESEITALFQEDCVEGLKLPENIFDLLTEGQVTITPSEGELLESVL